MAHLCFLALLGFTLSSLVSSVPVIQDISEPQPPSAFPIGTSSGANAKTAGRLFDIDGRVEYFAGK